MNLPRPAQNTLFDLPHLSILNLIGEKASEFLQGQISCDINQVTANTMRQGALCNLKGRVLALPDVLSWHGLKLILPLNLLEKTQKSLAATAMLSRVALEHAKQYHLFGFYLHDATQPLPFEGTWPSEKHAVLTQDNACAYCLGDNFYLLLVEASQLEAIKSSFAQQNLLQDSEAWHALRLQQGEIQIYPESRGLFLPHRLGLQNTGYLNFDKGCYKGQEIIARTHYRAKIKHAMKVCMIKTEEDLKPGLRIMTEDGTREVGELVDFCGIGNSNHVIIAASLLLEHPSIVRFEGCDQTIQLN
ncbi:MAG: folate-binding protein YgfZ [Legionellaceae bacterium]|nr:folate-binding protein YgfZ [Legionellaceae bacterium]